MGVLGVVYDVDIVSVDVAIGGGVVVVVVVGVVVVNDLVFYYHLRQRFL